jgi:hypothetical protein
MTLREREILIKSVSWTDKSLTVNEEKAFQAGARWADKTMIDKACEWMKEQVYQEYGGGPLERLIPDERIADFRKAMEE